MLTFTQTYQRNKCYFLASVTVESIIFTLYHSQTIIERTTCKVTSISFSRHFQTCYPFNKLKYLGLSIDCKISRQTILLTTQHKALNKLRGEHDDCSLLSSSLCSESSGLPFSTIFYHVSKFSIAMLFRKAFSKNVPAAHDRCMYVLMPSPHTTFRLKLKLRAQWYHL